MHLKVVQLPMGLLLFFSTPAWNRIDRIKCTESICGLAMMALQARRLRKELRSRNLKAGATLALLGAAVVAAWLVWQQLALRSRGGGGGASIEQRMPASTVVVVGAAPVEDKSMGLLQYILPLTNFSAISAAAILDKAAALDSWRKRHLMQLQQTLFCSARLHREPLPGSTQVPFGNVSLHVYAGSDIVSNMLNSKAHTWEEAETQEMLWALRQHFAHPRQYRRRRQQHEAVAAGRGGSVLRGGGVAGLRRRLRVDDAGGDDRPLFVDIGANVGWFALNAAAAGGRVAAFEAMSSNVALLRRSLCSNPWLAERIALYATGLGSSSADCFIISGTNNRGDGHTVCNTTHEAAIAAANAAANATYEVRGAITLRRLDSLLAEDVQVMKIDVEGFELQVLEGASGLLQRHNVWFIMAECNRDIIGRAGQERYLRFLDAMGYRVSLYSFRGPFLPAESARAGAPEALQHTKESLVNLYCVKKQLAKFHEDSAQAVAAAAVAGAMAEAQARGAAAVHAVGRRQRLLAGRAAE